MITSVIDPWCTWHNVENTELFCNVLVAAFGQVSLEQMRLIISKRASTAFIMEHSQARMRPAVLHIVFARIFLVP